MTPRIPALSLGLLLVTPSLDAQTTVFSTDFESGMPAEIAPGTATLTGVQGYAGLGPATSQFGGSFLRSETGNTVTLTLTGLPAHDELHLDFLFAAIDSLDGAGSPPAGDFFRINIDGVQVFREAFANALASQIQTYTSPPGVELARHQNLGFTVGGVYLDSAYYLGGDPFFAAIPHAGSTATIEFRIEGPGIQPISDESWAVENLRVIVNGNFQGNVAAYGPVCGPIYGATGLPRIGNALTLTLTSFPSNTTAAFGTMGLGNTAFGSYLLPYPLNGFGAPGCWIVADMSITLAFPMSIAGPSATRVLAVPTHACFVGLQLYSQGWVMAPGTNALGVQTSNGLRINIGQ